MRLAELEATQERLQVQSRLGRLERLARTSPRRAASPQPAGPAAAPTPTGQQPPSFDYMTFENRFRPEETVRERQSAYLELLRTRKRVVDLGCGRGELLELLGEADVSAYGVDLDPDNVAVCQEKGLEMIRGRRDLAPRRTRGVARGRDRRVPPDRAPRHRKLCGDSSPQPPTELAGGGILMLETPNPESLLAGSINFHRDPTHVRPVHPETLSFLCESAGFRDVEIRRLAPVPADVRLPQQSPDEDPLGEHMSVVVDQLNELIYGYQDYALIARR